MEAGRHPEEEELLFLVLGSPPLQTPAVCGSHAPLLKRQFPHHTPPHLSSDYKLFSSMFGLYCALCWASLEPQMVKNLPATQETWVQSLGQKDPLEKRMPTHSSILAWRIPRTKEPGGLQSMGSQRVRHDWATIIFTLYVTCTNLISYYCHTQSGFIYIIYMFTNVIHIRSSSYSS